MRKTQCAANASKLGADASKGFIVGGSSAGSNISAVLTHLARDEKLSPPLTGAYLHIPAVLSPEAVPEHLKSEYRSYEQNRNSPILNVKAIEFFRKFYKPDPKSELFNPFIWPTGHKDLPPTYLQIAGLDPLRDDGLLYERELRNSGVKTKIDVYPGVPHAFEGLFPQLSLAKTSTEDKVTGFGWLLGA
jgi:acetyl esterase/lipase